MLTQIPEENVDIFCDILRREWPRSMHVVNYIKTCLKWKKNKKDLEVSLLYHGSNMESGVFIGILKSGCIQPIVTVYALDSYEEILKTELSNCEIIWKEDKIDFELILNKHVPILKQILFENSFQTCDYYRHVSLAMSTEEAEKLEISCPQNMEFRPLSAGNLNGIFETWVMNQIHTIEELQNSLELNNGSALGLFCKENGTLIANSLRSHSGVICALQTIDGARGKGYGKLILKMVTKVLAQHNIEPIAYADTDNEIAMSLFRSVGYRIVGDHLWIQARERKNSLIRA